MKISSDTFLFRAAATRPKTPLSMVFGVISFVVLVGCAPTRDIVRQRDEVNPEEHKNVLSAILSTGEIVTFENDQGSFVNNGGTWLIVGIGKRNLAKHTQDSILHCLVYGVLLPQIGDTIASVVVDGQSRRFVATFNGSENGRLIFSPLPGMPEVSSFSRVDIDQCEQIVDIRSRVYQIALVRGRIIPAKIVETIKLEDVLVLRMVDEESGRNRARAFSFALGALLVSALTLAGLFALSSGAH